MSRPNQIPVLDANVSPRWQQQRPSSLRKSVTGADSTPRASGRWSTHMQHREFPVSRLASPRKSAPGDPPRRRPSVLRTSPGRSTSSPEDDLILGAEICTAILKDRSAIDGQRSSRAVKVWDASAGCLVEIDTSEVSPTTSPIASGDEPTSTSGRGGQAEHHERESVSPKPVTRKSIARLSAVGAPEGIAPLQATHQEAASSQAGSQVAYPCPFRKRNPARFNIRDHEACARAQFRAISDLKRHILTQHQPRSDQCPRCGLALEGQAALAEHLVVPKDQMCELATGQMTDDFEDSISRETERTLAACHVFGDTWEAIWRLVFPTDKDVPEPDFQPVVELVEIERALDDGQGTLKDSLQEKLRLLLPDTIEDSYCTFLTGQLELVFETHLANTMRQCLARSGSTVDRVGPIPMHRAAGTRDAQVRRSTRRSRRSTMLQSIRLLDFHDALPDVHRETLPPQHRVKQPDISQTHASYAERRPTTVFRTEAAANSAPSRASALRPISHNVMRSPLQTTVPSESRYPQDNNDAEDYAASRDSRDSGIGLPCDVCESEVCRCRDVFSLPEEQIMEVKQQDRGTDTTTPPPTPPKSLTSTPKSSVGRPYQFQAGGSGAQDPPYQIQNYSAPLTTKSQPSLRHQPRLRVKTKDISTSYESFNGVATVGGTFSPQSFKQRVLRTQHVQFEERNTWTA